MLNIVLNGRSLYPIPDKPEPVVPPLPDLPMESDNWVISEDGNTLTLKNGTHYYMYNRSNSWQPYQSTTFNNASWTDFTDNTKYTLTRATNFTTGTNSGVYRDEKFTATIYNKYSCVLFYPTLLTGSSTSGANGWEISCYNGDASSLPDDGDTWRSGIKKMAEVYGYVILGPNCEIVGVSPTYINMSQYIPPSFYQTPDPAWELADDKSSLTLKSGLYVLDTTKKFNSGGYFEIPEDVVMQKGYATATDVDYMTEDYSANMSFRKPEAVLSNSITSVEMKVNTSTTSTFYLGNYDWDDKFVVTRNTWTDVTNVWTENNFYSPEKSIFGTSSSKGFSFPTGTSFEMKFHFSNDPTADIYRLGFSLGYLMYNVPGGTGSYSGGTACYICDAQGNRITALDSYFRHNSDTDPCWMQNSQDDSKKTVPGNLIPVGGYLYWNSGTTKSATTASYYYSQFGGNSGIRMFDLEPISQTPAHFMVEFYDQGGTTRIHINSFMETVTTYPEKLNKMGYFNLIVNSSGLLELENITDAPKYYKEA